jgi:hypothetical protein
MMSVIRRLDTILLLILIGCSGIRSRNDTEMSVINTEQFTIDNIQRIMKVVLQDSLLVVFEDKTEVLALLDSSRIVVNDCFEQKSPPPIEGFFARDTSISYLNTILIDQYKKNNEDMEYKLTWNYWVSNQDLKSGDLVFSLFKPIHVEGYSFIKVYMCYLNETNWRHKYSIELLYDVEMNLIEYLIYDEEIFFESDRCSVCE